MLLPATRAQFNSLLDAAVLAPGEPDRPAIVYLETGAAPVAVSRAAFGRAARAHAAGLQQLGIRPRDLLLVAHTQSLESIYAFWGALLAGAIPSMFPTLTEKLDPAIYMAGLGELARLSGARAILTTDDFAPQLARAVACPVYGSSTLAAAVGAGDASFTPRPPAADGDIAFLQHSSGTTGLQKGVALSHSAVLNQLANYAAALELGNDDVVVSWLPLYHDMGLIAGFILPLVQGLPLVLMSPFDWVQHPALLFRAIHDYRGTLCWLPNFAYNHCARRIRQRDVGGLSAASMRQFVNCSEPVHHTSHRLFLERFAANGVRPDILGVSYAMAENTFAVTQTAPGRPAHLDVVDREALATGHATPLPADHPHATVQVSCGPPILGTELRVVDDAGRPLPDRHIGELAIRGDSLLSGYYRRPDLDPFRDGWYLTGDRGYVAAGEVYVVGRRNDLIINAGKNIYPQDIEAIVNEVPGVRPGRVAAFGVYDEREGTELVAVVAETDAAAADRQRELAAAIRQAVARHTLVTVSYVHLVNPKWLIKTSSGKIARGANREKWQRETGRESGATG